MRRPYEKDRLYSLARIWCDYATRNLFSGISSEGKESVPDDGAIILAPNHSNTLIDALVILQDWKEATLFGARADIFRKPFINKILRFAKILPIHRVRDGAQEVLHNRETMNEVVDCLGHGMKYCMFCEGTHRPMHSLLPLKKGIVRTALTANARFGGAKPVYIVPMGLEYQDYYRLRTPLSIRYGEAINVTEFVAARGNKGEGLIYKELLSLLKERMTGLITHLPDDETYTGRWAIAKIAGQKVAMAAGEDLIKEAGDFETKRKKARISSWSLSRENSWINVLGRSIAWLLSLPFILFAAIASAPMWILSAILKKRLKDKAFSRTVNFGVKFAMTPLMLIIWAVVLFNFLPLKLAIAAFILALGSHTVFYEALERGRILLSDIRLLLRHKDLKERYDKLRIKINKYEKNSFDCHSYGRLHPYS